ncbi:hypothetical protein Tco_1521464 [Tanacetum coccineum]
MIRSCLAADGCLYDRDTARYNCQLDEKWFDLTTNTLRDTLQITPVNNNNPFSSPPTPDALINFVNELGYPKVTSVFERPRAPVLQILWGIINRAHIDYAKMMWEEFTQSIHSFVEDKKNLALYTQGKKKANPLVIPSVRFTNLIIYHLQSKHKFHPRPDSPLHLPYEEYVLGYLKFCAKGTKWEKVAKHQRYLAGEEVSNPDSPAGVPVNEPRFGDEEADMQKVVEESLKDVHAAHQGPLPPVVIREPESGKFQPLPEVQGKGKEKVGLTDSETESDDDVPLEINLEAQDEGQAGPNPGK